MFTGIVTAAGRVESFERRASAWRLILQAPTVAAEAALGDSVAVNGACLTVVEAGEGRLHFDVLEETRRLTNLEDARAGSRVNLEPSLRVGERMGGHFVSGHVDGLGVIESFEPRGADRYLRVRPPPQFLRYLVYKGCVAVDGVSLTVAEVDAAGFAIWLIPHTVAATAFCERRPGDRVNLEFDLMAKYVERILGDRAPAPRT